MRGPQRALSPDIAPARTPVLGRIGLARKATVHASGSAQRLGTRGARRHTGPGGVERSPQFMARRFGRLDTGQRGPARGLLEQFSGPHGGVRRLQRPGACPKPVPRGVLTSGAAAGPVPLRWGMPVGWRADLFANRRGTTGEHAPWRTLVLITNSQRVG